MLITGRRTCRDLHLAGRHRNSVASSTFLSDRPATSAIGGRLPRFGERVAAGRASLRLVGMYQQRRLHPAEFSIPSRSSPCSIFKGFPMTYTSILVSLDNQPECAARTAAVLNLAKAMGSHVTGVAPTDLLDLRTNLRTAASVASLPMLARDALLEDATRAAVSFDVACKLADVACKSLVDESDMSSALDRRGRVNDLLVLTQSDPGAHAGQAFKNPQIEATILASARPVIELPYANAARTLGTRVLVAWDDSHAAARAVADALPMLRRARNVQVMSINGDAPRDEGGLSEDLSSVTEWLARHGVAAHAQFETTEISIAETLLSRAADLGIDLIVMGAFGRSRWRERLLGGTTRDILGSMTVPVLMSH